MQGEKIAILRGGVKWVIALVVLAVGGGIYGYFMQNPVVATKQEQAVLVPQVEVLQVVAEDHSVHIEAHGQVEAVTMTQLVSEVGGAIEYVSPQLKKGAKFSKGALLVQVNQADYLVQLEQNRAAVADAELHVAQEEARAEQALREWQKLGRGSEPSALVKREPQLKSARARLVAAIALVDKAERDLAKTRIVAPYDCLITESAVDAGGYVTPAGPIAQLYATEKVQVTLPLSLEDIGYLGNPLVGEKVMVEAQVGQKLLRWQGNVVRTEGVVERATHTMNVVVEVQPEGEGLFALPPVGLFASGAFSGQQLEGAVKLPRVVIRTNDRVWLVDSEDRLQIRKVEIERRENDYVLVSGGLKQGERVVTSPIAHPIEGMRVEVVESSAQ